VTESDIQAFETRLNARLPEDYRQFLMQHNGGKPEPYCFRVDMNGFPNESAITYFLCLSDTEQDSLSRYLKIYRDRIPVNLLPIALPLAVNLVCLSIAGDDYGTVYFWDHNWENDELDYTNVHFVAHSFNELLNNLYPED
jgi:hypothetical protein